MTQGESAPTVLSRVSDTVNRKPLARYPEYIEERRSFREQLALRDVLGCVTTKPFNSRHSSHFE